MILNLIECKNIQRGDIFVKNLREMQNLSRRYHYFNFFPFRLCDTGEAAILSSILIHYDSNFPLIYTGDYYPI
jgi:hypothetical protein